MSSAKVNISVCFRSRINTTHFLFQALNLGKTTDELKFVFTDPESGVGGIYVQSRDGYGTGDVARPIPEVSYHHDGSMLFKLPSYSNRTNTVYKNSIEPNYRRTPLSDINFWEWFLRYKVYNYELCKKEHISHPHLLSIDSEWFDNTPFECRFYLGNKSCPTPIASQRCLVQRIDQLSKKLDLLLVFIKLEERGYYQRIGNTDIMVWSTNNIIEAILASSLNERFENCET